jgi:hypothetical protein
MSACPILCSAFEIEANLKKEGEADPSLACVSRLGDSFTVITAIVKRV